MVARNTSQYCRISISYKNSHRLITLKARLTAPQLILLKSNCSKIDLLLLNKRSESFDIGIGMD